MTPVPTPTPTPLAWPTAPSDLPAAAGPTRRTCLRWAVAAAVSQPAWSAATTSGLAFDGPQLPDAPLASASAASAELEVRDLDWVDAKRDRPVPARLYWPPVSGGAQRLPLLVFSHGLGGSRLGYSYLGRHLAAQGIACLHLQHVGSDRALWFGNPFTLVARLQRAAREEEAMHRALDLRHALDRVLADAQLASRIDPERIAAGGHSYGANTTMLAIGARVERAGERLALADERVRGALLLSSPPFYGEPDPAAVLGSVLVPSLHLTTTEDVINVPGYRSPATDRVAVYRAMGGTHKALAVFEGGSHSIFTDRSTPGGPELNARVKRATQDLSLAFLQDLFALADTPAPHLPEARARHAGLIHQFEQQA